MKVNIIKGPNYEQTIEKGYEALYQILARKAAAEVKKNTQGKPDKT